MSKNTIAASILIILYTVGIIGIGGDFDDRIVLLTPINLLLSVGLAFWVHPGPYPPLWKLVGICFLTGVGIEMLGVQTGLIFGSYQYGPVLGPKILGTPLMIGVNWTMLVYAAGSTINAVFKNQPIFLKSLFGAAMLTTLDFLIEPVAIMLDFWRWEHQVVPMQNYIAWFFVALPLLAAYFIILKKTSNKVAILLLLLQFLFFGILQP